MKNTALFSLSAILSLFLLTSSCKTAQSGQAPLQKPGIFKVTILYPAGEGKTFDMDYYEHNHMPMVAGVLGKNLLFYEIDKGVSGRTPSDKLPFVAIGYFYVQDIAEYNTAISQNRDKVINDIPKYTNIQPVIQISELKAVVKSK